MPSLVHRIAEKKTTTRHCKIMDNKFSNDYLPVTEMAGAEVGMLSKFGKMQLQMKDNAEKLVERV